MAGVIKSIGYGDNRGTRSRIEPQSGAEVDPLILAGISGFGYGEEEAPRDRCKIFRKGGSRTEYNLYASMKDSQSMKSHLLVARTGCGGTHNANVAILTYHFEKNMPSKFPSPTSHVSTPLFLSICYLSPPVVFLPPTKTRTSTVYIVSTLSFFLE